MRFSYLLFLIIIQMAFSNKTHVSFFTTCYAASENEVSETEGSIQSVYLQSYRYASPPSDWDTQAIKRKAQEGCQYAFLKLNEQITARFICSEITVGSGSISNIVYEIKSKGNSQSIPEVDYSPSINSIRILTNYHFRKDGKLPYYKNEVFRKDWIEQRCENLGLDVAGLYIIVIVSVIDENNNINLHVVSRNSLKSNTDAWFLRHAFSLFESPEDILQSELCLLLQKMSLRSPGLSPPKGLEKRLGEVEKELEELKQDD
jgi:hypothetical protein